MTIDMREGQLQAAPAVAALDARDAELLLARAVGDIDARDGVHATPAVADRGAEVDLTPAAAAVDAGDAEVQPAPVAAPRPKKTWREQRWERRRRRLWLEEALGWVLVPAIVIGCYYVVNGTLNALGTSPAAIMEGISLIASAL
jgi:hypothetical protein